MNNNLECKLDGCCESALRKFVVMEGEKIVDEALSCGLHDIKTYRQLCEKYMPVDYKIKIKILEEGKWKNLKL